MRVLIQRVSEASLIANGNLRGKMQAGFVLFLGIEGADSQADIDWLIGKIIGLRIFADEDGKMNRSIGETKGSIMLVSQFTLHASTKKGNRPSFIRAARPEQAIPIYESFKQALEQSGNPLICGIFGADMQVQLINDGPVTIWMDSKSRE